MKEEGKSQEVRKSENPEDVAKMEEKTHSGTTPVGNTPQSEIKNKSDPDSHRDENPKRRSPFEHLKKTSKSEKSEITTMEVHHHPKLEHKAKPWKEYILEGLMIFLAVTMGFFAENLREHISDNHRETEFARALYTELRDDSAVAAKNRQLRVEKEMYLDYLHAYFKDSSLTVLPKKFYLAFTTGLYLINSHAFEPKDGVLSQLRSSGSERYFNGVEMQKLLGDLNVCVNNIRSRNDQEYQFFSSPLKQFLLKRYDFSWLDQLRRQEADTSLVIQLNVYRNSNREIKGNILNSASFDRGEAANIVIFYKQMVLSTQTLQLNNYIVTNRRLLLYLRKHYTLEND